MFNRWKNISLFKFQQIEEINGRTINELDKVLFTTCVVFDLTEYELDTLPLKKATRLIGIVQKTFDTAFKPIAGKKIGEYVIDYDPSKLTFGQYIELSYFLQKNHIQNAHYIMASVASPEAEKHRERAEYFLTQPVNEVIGAMSLFIERFAEFNKEYLSLFGVAEGADEEEGPKDYVDFFNKRWGWIYSASRVAEYERITLDEAYALPIRRAFNNLAFLKAKDKLEKVLSKAS